MVRYFLYFLIYIEKGLCLWPKGIVHYAINSKDYDIHSQDLISSALSAIQKEVCVKFFNTPPDYAATPANKILYINNPDKRKACPPAYYNYTGSVVDMPVGYKCLNTKDVSRIVVDMLRASIDQSASEMKPYNSSTHPLRYETVNSYDLVRKFQKQNEDASSSLVSSADRNYINAHYHGECGALSPIRRQPARRYEGDGVRMSSANEQYYKDKLWPLGVVMYGVDQRLRNSDQLKQLQSAMRTVEESSCVLFEEAPAQGELRARSLLWLAPRGAEAPRQGFLEGNQSISLQSMVSGAPGHAAHALSMVLRALGLPMHSNRHDRDYYVNVHWDNVIKGKEHYVEKTPSSAWLLDSTHGYDFESATHAPANYMCRDCSRGETTFEPVQDHLWQRTLAMGHRAALSAADKEMLHVLYSQPCQDRYATHIQ